MKRIRRYVSRFLVEGGFTNNIKLFVLLESERACVYFFEYEGDLYHIVASDSNGVIGVSLNVQIDAQIYDRKVN